MRWGRGSGQSLAAAAVAAHWRRFKFVRDRATLSGRVAYETQVLRIDVRLAKNLCELQGLATWSCTQVQAGGGSSFRLQLNSPF